MVIIVQPGRYNNATGKAQSCQAEDGLATSYWYAQSLVKAGLARWPEIATTSPEVAEATQEAPFKQIAPANRTIISTSPPQKKRTK